MRGLEQPEQTSERALFRRMKFRNQKAMRSGHWKRLSLDGDEFLYDLSKDQRERANLGKREPARLEVTCVPLSRGRPRGALGDGAMLSAMRIRPRA